METKKGGWIEALMNSFGRSRMKRHFLILLKVRQAFLSVAEGLAGNEIDYVQHALNTGPAGIYRFWISTESLSR